MAAMHRSIGSFPSMLGIALVIFLVEMWATNLLLSRPPTSSPRPTLDQQVSQEQTLIRVLENMWSALPDRSSSREVSFVFPSLFETPKHDITLVTHASVGKLNVLLYQIQAWGGPVSCAVNVENKEDVEILVSFVKLNKAKLEATAIHIRLERHRGYPVNHLRNLALNSAVSDYVVVMDVDLIPDLHAYSFLKSALRHNTSSFVGKLHKRTLYVLPAFERLMPSELPTNPVKGNNVIAKSMMPLSRQLLLPMIESGEVTSFYEKDVKKGHRATNFSYWYQDVPNEFSYPIDYELRFEPYVVAFRHGLPQYWPYFRGFGFNKLSWFIELNCLGYKFEVLRNHFVIHKNHPRGTATTKFLIKPDAIQQWLVFKKYLIETHHFPKQELRDWTDRRGDSAWKEYMAGDQN